MNNNIEVALTTFNGEKYLYDQLFSIFNQTMKIDRLIICDDNSQDDTLSIIKRFIKRGYPLTLYENNKNLGYALNFMKCIKLCNSEFIFLSDQDDIWHENKVEEMMGLIKNNSNFLCWMHDCAITDSKMNVKLKSKLENIERYGFTENSFVMGACMVIKKEAKNYIYPYPSDINSYGHDDWIAWVMRSTDNLKNTKKVLIDYRRHSTITSSGSFNSAFQNNIFKRYLYRFIDTFKTSDNGIKNKIKRKQRNYLWSKLCTKNFKGTSYNIRNSHSIKTQKIALGLNENNFFKRILQIYRIKKTGYYSFRSNWFSIFIDLFFPNL